MLAFCFFWCGALSIASTMMDEYPLDQHIDSPIFLAGVICDEPQVKEKTVRFCFKPYQNEHKILIIAERYPEYVYGDEISISGTLQFPKNFETYSGGPIFDYVSYLEKDGIRYIMPYPRISLMNNGRGNSILQSLFALKKFFIEKMRQLIPEPEASLLGGILLGDKQGLSKDMYENFKIAGLVHILVLSGYNVTIVAESLMKFFSFLPLMVARCFGAGSIILFALMTGASATTIRATIMALIVILVRSTARTYDISRALIFAAVIMVIHNPRILAFDISFQLSFLATLGLVYVSPLVSDRIGFVTEKYNLREVLATSLGVQIAVTPYILFSMGTISLIAPISNLFVLPFMPAIMFFGFVSVSLGMVFGVIALPFAWITTWLLSYTKFIVKICRDIPFASLQIQTNTFVLVCMYTVLVGFLIYFWRRKNVSLRSPS